PAAAGPTAILVQHHVSANVHAPEGCGLRDGPAHRAARRGHAESFGGTPERYRRVVAAHGFGAYIAGDAYVIGRGSQADYLGIKADRDVYLVVAGQKEQGIALRPELVPLLHGVDLV